MLGRVCGVVVAEMGSSSVRPGRSAAELGEGGVSLAQSRFLAMLGGPSCFTGENGDVRLPCALPHPGGTALLRKRRGTGTDQQRLFLAPPRHAPFRS